MKIVSKGGVNTGKRRATLPGFQPAIRYRGLLNNLTLIDISSLKNRVYYGYRGAIGGTVIKRLERVENGEEGKEEMEFETLKVLEGKCSSIRAVENFRNDIVFIKCEDLGEHRVYIFRKIDNKWAYSFERINFQFTRMEVTSMAQDIFLIGFYNSFTRTLRC